MATPDPNRPGVVATNGIDPDYDGGGAPKEINPATGQHKSYWVLSEDERAKGFVRPVRRSYVHNGPFAFLEPKTNCSGLTTMALDIAETFARDPNFYGSTFCTKCRGHFPVGDFTWDKTDELVGS